MNLEVLTRPFSPDEVKQRKGPWDSETGTYKMLDYVETHSVISRLNEAFNGLWSFHVVKYEHHGPFTVTARRQVDGKWTPVEEQHHEVIIYGELSADGVTKQQFGSSEDVYPSATGDMLKAAGSDCLKKCATEFGVALELYDRNRTVRNGGQRTYPPEEALATDRQRAYLERLLTSTISESGRARVKTALNKTLTKAEASVIIEEVSKEHA